MVSHPLPVLLTSCLGLSREVWPPPWSAPSLTEDTLFSFLQNRDYKEIIKCTIACSQHLSPKGKRTLLCLGPLPLPTSHHCPPTLHSSCLFQRLPLHIPPNSESWVLLGHLGKFSGTQGCSVRSLELPSREEVTPSGSHLGKPANILGAAIHHPQQGSQTPRRGMVIGLLGAWLHSRR